MGRWWGWLSPRKQQQTDLLWLSLVWVLPAVQCIDSLCNIVQADKSHCLLDICMEQQQTVNSRYIERPLDSTACILHLQILNNLSYTVLARGMNST